MTTDNYEPALRTVEDEGLLTLDEFVEKAKMVLEDMPESWPDCTGEDAEVPRTLDFWMEQLENAIHNS